MMYNPVTDSFSEFTSVKEPKKVLYSMENIGIKPFDISDMASSVTEDGKVIMKEERSPLIAPEEIFTPLETISVDVTIPDETPTTTAATTAKKLNKNQGTNASILMSKLTSRGFSDYQAAGILGNLAVESGFSSNTYNKNDVGLPGGGLAGWRGSKLKELQLYASTKGKSWKDLDTLVDFLIQDIEKNSEVYNLLKSSKNAEEAAKAFMHYERFAGYDGTLNTARKFQKTKGWSDERTMKWILNNHNTRKAYANEILANWQTLKK